MYNYNRTMAMFGELPHPSRNEITLSGVLFALSDIERLAMARQLQAGPLDAANCVIPGDGSMPKSTKSHLMKVLREAGVIRSEPNGRHRTLTLRREDIEFRFPGLLDAILLAEAGPSIPSL